VQTFEYIHWAKTQTPVKYNLARSGVVDLHLSDLPFALNELDITGLNVYGHRKLIHAIAERYRVESNQVVLTQGTSFANHLVCAGLLQPGDQVIVEQPAYEVLHKLPLLFHAQVVRLPRRYENHFQIDPDELKKLMSDKVRLIVLTDLHNPSGVKLEPGILEQIGRIARNYGVYVLVDEVYLESYYENRPPLSAKSNDAFITTSSLTKAYGLSGLRCGWIICEAQLAQKLRLLNDFFGVVGVFISEQIGAVVMQNLEALAAIHRSYLSMNVCQVYGFVDENPLLEWIPPDAGMIAFPKLKSRHDSQKLARLLREKYQTSIVPGSFFEMPQHFRIAWGLETEALKTGLQHVGQALAEIED